MNWSARTPSAQQRDVIRLECPNLASSGCADLEAFRSAGTKCSTGSGRARPAPPGGPAAHASAPAASDLRGGLSVTLTLPSVRPRGGLPLRLTSIVLPAVGGGRPVAPTLPLVSPRLWPAGHSDAPRPVSVVWGQRWRLAGLPLSKTGTDHRVRERDSARQARLRATIFDGVYGRTGGRNQ
jgi:hypothetical protein